MKNFINTFIGLSIAVMFMGAAFAVPGVSVNTADASLLGGGGIVFGCTDESATNYNPSATANDGSCQYPAVAGCTDILATNYDIQADTDDGSCVYPEPVVTSCDLTANATNIVSGGNVMLSWDTQGFDEFRLNGQLVSGATGDKTFTNVTVNTTYTFVATNSDGDRCQTTVDVYCLPPVVEECELDINKTVSTHSAQIGDEITYTITVNNTGDADCTGGGVKIFDEVDENLIYLSHTITSNLTAGYGSKPVYSSSDRTLRFNGNTLTPGESGEISWIGKVASPTQCGDFVVENQAKTTARELNNFQTWVYSQIVQTDINNNCDKPICEPGDQHYNPEADLTGSIYAERKGRVVNSSEYCGYKIGLASYEKFDEIIDNQKLFDSATGVVAAKSTAELMVSVPSCKYQIDLFYGHVLTSLDGQRYGDRLLDAKHVSADKPYCGVTEEEFATVIAHKIVCTDEADLPNYGAGGSNLTANSAANWVASHASCSLESGWKFQWTDSQSNDPGDTTVGAVGSPWSTFGPTNADGQTSVEINLDTLNNSKVWFREVLQNGYIPFTHGQNAGTNVDDVSAEFYCNTDVINYDNYDFIAGMQADQEYHCIAWNSPVPTTPAPSCDSFTATPNTIEVGDTTVLRWESTNAVQAFLNNSLGEVDVDGSMTISPTTDTVYRLTLIGAEDKTVDCEVPLTVSDDPVPVCEFFTATPNALPVGGGNVKLDWKVTNATNVSISPTVGTVSLDDSRVVNVTQGTTYVLTAEDDNGDTVTCPAPVTVADPAPVFSCENNVDFTISDTSIRRGTAVTLDWSTTDVDSVSISNTSATPLSGNRSVSPADDTTYTLTATQGTRTISCPVSVDVSSGGGGGGSVTPRCDLDISDKKITAGEEITLRWDTSNASDVIIEDDRGNVIFTTEKYLSKDKEDFYDGSIKVKPTRDTQYTLTAERGSRDRECEVEVEVEDGVVVLQTRDQQPLVAGISLSQVPYTGFEAGPFMTILFYALLVAWSLFITYLLVIRNRAVPASVQTFTPAPTGESNREAMKQAEARHPDLFVPSVMEKMSAPQATPSNLPTGIPVAEFTQMSAQEVSTEANQATDTQVTAIENRAHSQKALLSSDAVRYFISATDSTVDRDEAIDTLVVEAKKTYPLEDGWIVLNQARMQSLCDICAFSASTPEATPATVPTGTGSLAEAIVTGNVVAAYQMIGHRPMFALADAAADLDAVYRHRKGEQSTVSELLITETASLSDAQVSEMIAALTGALDGTYTDEASAVKMSIMKAVKVTA